MAKYIKKVSEKDLTHTQQGEAGRLGLTFTEWRWYDATRRAGSEGVQWGCYPAHVFRKLVEKDLVKGNPMTVWAAEFAPASRQP